MKANRAVSFVVIGIILMLIVSCTEQTTEPKPTVAIPTFNPPGGIYTEPQEIEILCATEGAYITYTIDESTPGPTSSIYSEPLLIDSPTTLKARAFKDGWQDSEVNTINYLISDIDSLEYYISLTVSPDTIYYGMYSQIRAKVTDKDDYPVVGIVVKFKGNQAGDMGSYIITDQAGVATTRYYADEQDDGEVVITAQIKDIKVTANITVVPVPPVSRVTFSYISPGVILEATLILSATAYNEDNSWVVDGTLMQFEADLGTFKDAPSGHTTYGYTVNGRANVIWKSKAKSGNVTFTVTAGDKKDQAESYIYPGEPDRITALVEMRKPGHQQSWEHVPAEGIDVEKHSDYDFRISAKVRDRFDNEVRSGIPIRYGNRIAATDYNGNVYFDFSIDDKSGVIIIQISTLCETIKALTSIRINSTIVHSLHLPEGPFYVDVGGGGGVESRQIPGQLRDHGGNLVYGRHWVTFEITDWPGKNDPEENPADRPSINQRGLSEEVRTEKGNAVVSFHAPKRAGKSTVRLTYQKEDDTLIVSNNLDIYARPHSPATIELSVGGANSAANMGNGMWRIEVTGLVKDRYGNEVIDGTVVHFSLADDPPPPTETSITGAGYVGNPGDDNEDGLPGVAHTHLFFHGKDTNSEIRIVAGSGDISNHLQFKLPLQYPEFSIRAEPQKIEFYSGDGGAGTNPVFIDAEVIAVVKDGQGSYISGEEIVLQSPGSFRYHPSVVPDPPQYGSPEYRPEYIYTLAGPVGDTQFGQKGHAYAIIRVHGDSLPHPVDEEFSKIDLQIMGRIVGADKIATTGLTVIRWLKEKDF